MNWRMNRILLLLVVSFAVSAGSIWAEESHGHNVFHKHHVGVFASGATTNLHEDHTSFTLGADYEYRISPRVGIGVLGDVVFAPHRETILAGALVTHPAGGLKVLFAPGVIFIDGSSENHFVARFGFGYDFHVARASLAPTFNLDVIEGHVSLVYGVTLGFGF